MFQENVFHFRKKKSYIQTLLGALAILKKTRDFEILFQSSTCKTTLPLHEVMLPKKKHQPQTVGLNCEP